MRSSIARVSIAATSPRDEPARSIAFSASRAASIPRPSSVTRMTTWLPAGASLEAQDGLGGLARALAALRSSTP
ncbi:MAG: hypothetical protein U0271_10470 [Polyangiaceae bacterium]